MNRLAAFTRIEHLAHSWDIPVPREIGVLYCVEHTDDGKPQMLWFSCPCGCGETRALFLGEGNPSWTYEERDGAATVSPSVLVTVGCTSHFFIRNNRVDWL